METREYLELAVLSQSIVAQEKVKTGRHLAQLPQLRIDFRKIRVADVRKSATAHEVVSTTGV